MEDMIGELQAALLRAEFVLIGRYGKRHNARVCACPNFANPAVIGFEDGRLVVGSIPVAPTPGMIDNAQVWRIRELQSLPVMTTACYLLGDLDSALTDARNARVVVARHAIAAVESWITEQETPPAPTA